MKKVLYILISFFVIQHGRAACTYSSNTTITPATFIACGTVSVTTGVVLTVNAGFSTNANLTLTGGGTININGTLTMTNGAHITNNGPTLTMTGLQQNNGSQLSANSGAIVVNGNAQFNNGSQVDGGGGTLTVSGTATANSGSDVWGWPAGNCSNCNFSSSVQPIKLLKFSAVYSASKVNLEWITVTETNNRFFTIEKSTDGVNFSYFKDVRSKAPNGNSLTKLHYTLIDENPFSGISYYRLKQTDYNGDHEYFNIVSVFSKSTKEISFSVLPNPNNGKFTAVFTGIENNGVASISVADIVGKLVYEKDLMAENGINALDIIPANTLGKGIYFCTLISAGQKHTVKVVVN